MAIDEKRLNVERRSSKDRRSGVDTRSEKEKGSVGKGARQSSSRSGRESRSSSPIILHPRRGSAGRLAFGY